MKVLVIGNCQARPLANILKDTRELEVTSPIILHLAREEDFAHHESLMTEADLIITQATTDTFEPANLRSSRIKARFGINVIVWPNLFLWDKHPIYDI